MSKYLRYCPTCNEKDKEKQHVILGRYSTYLKEDEYVCKTCGGQVEDLNVLSTDYKIFVEISNDPKFIDSMIQLAKSDPIEYQLKLSQFKAQLAQQESVKAQNDNIPKCPTCGSTKLSKVSVTSKAGSVFMFGLLSQKVKKTWHCDNCGYEW